MRHLRRTDIQRLPSTLRGLIHSVCGLSFLLLGSPSHAWEASIERDAGVPHIYGETDADMALARLGAGRGRLGN